MSLHFTHEKMFRCVMYVMMYVMMSKMYHVIMLWNDI